MFDVMRKSRIQEGQDPRSAIFMVVADHYLAAEYLKRHSGKPDALIGAEASKVYYETLAYYLSERNLKQTFMKWVKNTTIPQVPELRALFDDKAEAAYTNIPLRRAQADTLVLARYGEAGDKRSPTRGFSILYRTQASCTCLLLLIAAHSKSWWRRS